MGLGVKWRWGHQRKKTEQKFTTHKIRHPIVRAHEQLLCIWLGSCDHIRLSRKTIRCLIETTLEITNVGKQTTEMENMWPLKSDDIGSDLGICPHWLLVWGEASRLFHSRKWMIKLNNVTAHPKIPCVNFSYTYTYLQS